jgi:5'-deoxynucleotidase YfbR-like HD superfamily hydrolase
MSASLTHDDIETFVRQIILPFYGIQREMPVPMGDRRWENDAEHSWSVALLGCAIAPIIDPTLDTGRIAQFAIVHDLVEIHAGDTSIFASSDDHDTKADREAVAFARIRQDFGHFGWIIATIEDYEKRETNEAKFVYAVDKYIAMLYDYIDEGQYYRDKEMTKEMFDKYFMAHREKAQAHAGVGKYYNEVRDLLDAHSEYFHQQGGGK